MNVVKPDMSAAIHRRAKLAHEIKRITGCPVDRYLHPIFGFNIVKFDEVVLKSPDGKSCADVLTEKYGVEVCKMFERLLH